MDAPSRTTREAVPPELTPANCSVGGAKRKRPDNATQWRYQLAWRNTPAGQAKYRASLRRLVYRDKLRCLKAYGGDPPKCACCGESNLGFLTLDHVNSDGAAHRKALLSAPGGNRWRKLIRLGFPMDPPLQVLCFNCNFGRQNNQGVCPHHGYITDPNAPRSANRGAINA